MSPGFPSGTSSELAVESLLPLQVPAESTGSSDLCKSDQVGPLGLSGVKGKEVFAQQILFLVKSGSLCEEKNTLGKEVATLTDR